METKIAYTLDEADQVTCATTSRTTNDPASPALSLDTVCYASKGSASPASRMNVVSLVPLRHGS